MHLVFTLITAQVSTSDKVLGHYLQSAKAQLNISVDLVGSASPRVGYPVLRSTVLPELDGYVCPEWLGQKEADAICRSLGYSGGTT